MKRKISYAILGAVLGMTVAGAHSVQAQSSFTEAARTSGQSAIEELTDAQRQITLLERRVKLRQLEAQLQTINLEQLKILAETDELQAEQKEELSPEERLQRSLLRELERDPAKLLALQGISTGADGSVMATGQATAGGSLFEGIGIRPVSTPTPEPEEVVEVDVAPNTEEDDGPGDDLIGLNSDGSPTMPFQQMPMAMPEPVEQERGTPVVASIRGTGMNMKAVILFPSGGQYILGNRDEREGWQIRSVQADGVRACDMEKEDASARERCQNLPFGTQPIMPPPPSSSGFGGFDMGMGGMGGGEPPPGGSALPLSGGFQ